MCGAIGLLLFIGAAITTWQQLTTGTLDATLLLVFLGVSVLVGAGLWVRWRQATARHAQEDFWRAQGRDEAGR